MANVNDIINAQELLLSVLRDRSQQNNDDILRKINISIVNQCLDCPGLTEAIESIKDKSLLEKLAYAIAFASTSLTATEEPLDSGSRQSLNTLLENSRTICRVCGFPNLKAQTDPILVAIGQQFDNVLSNEALLTLQHDLELIHVSPRSPIRKTFSHSESRHLSTRIVRLLTYYNKKEFSKIDAEIDKWRKALTTETNPQEIAAYNIAIQFAIYLKTPDAERTATPLETLHILVSACSTLDEKVNLSDIQKIIIDLIAKETQSFALTLSKEERETKCQDFFGKDYKRVIRYPNPNPTDKLWFNGTKYENLMNMLASLTILSLLSIDAYKDESGNFIFRKENATSDRKIALSDQEIAKLYETLIKLCVSRKISDYYYPKFNHIFSQIYAAYANYLDGHHRTMLPAVQEQYFNYLYATFSNEFVARGSTQNKDSMIILLKSFMDTVTNLAQLAGFLRKLGKGLDTNPNANYIYVTVSDYVHTQHRLGDKLAIELSKSRGEVEPETTGTTAAAKSDAEEEAKLWSLLQAQRMRRSSSLSSLASSAPPGAAVPPATTRSGGSSSSKSSSDAKPRPHSG